MRSVSTLRCLGVCCDLLEVGLGVGEEDEVDHEEGGVEHEVGAADQHAARPHTQLETRHVVTRGTRVMPPPEHTRVASSPVVTSLSPWLAPGRDSRDYDGGHQVVRGSGCVAQQEMET